MSDTAPESPVTAPPPTPTSGAPTQEERNMGMLAHLSALAGYIVPLGNIIGPLVVRMMKGPQSAFVDDQAKESLNFQITMTIAIIACIVAMFCVVGIFLLPIVGLLDLIFIIVGAVKANQGVAYRYPFALRLIK